MKRKATRKRHFCGRSSAVNNDAGKERNEDAESGQPNLEFDLPEVDGSAKKLKLDDVLQEADQTNMSKENCFLLFNFSVIQQIIHLIGACQICSSKVKL